MHVIAKGRFIVAANKHPSDAKAIMGVYSVLNKGSFENVEKLKGIFKSVERFKYLDNAYVIDIAGNNIRLIAIIFFKTQKLFVKYVVDHKEYDKLTKRYRSGELGWP